MSIEMIILGLMVVGLVASVLRGEYLQRKLMEKDKTIDVLRVTIEDMIVNTSERTLNREILNDSLVDCELIGNVSEAIRSDCINVECYILNLIIPKFGIDLFECEPDEFLKIKSTIRQLMLYIMWINIE